MKNSGFVFVMISLLATELNSPGYAFPLSNDIDLLQSTQR